MNTQEELSALFERDLDRLRVELDSYEVDESLWVVTKDINNAAGNLMLHICGNLNHYVGAVLAHSGYVRERDLEFTGRATRSELERNIEGTKNVVLKYLAEVTDEELAQPYPQDVFDYPMSTRHLLIHLYGHLQYHLGQVNYHRRLI